jgi:polyhydroxyalkanoate synthesis regulator phasin
MAESENIFQKALYLGIGIAGYAAEKAGDTLQELKQQTEKVINNPDFAQEIQKIADDMVKKGKMTTDEARNFVNETIKQAQQKQAVKENKNDESTSQPRTIEIITDDDE